MEQGQICYMAMQLRIASQEGEITRLRSQLAAKTQECEETAKKLIALRHDYTTLQYDLDGAVRECAELKKSAEQAHERGTRGCIVVHAAPQPERSE